MIHMLLPAPDSSHQGLRLDPNKRLMAAVLQAVIDDCRGGSRHRRSPGRRINAQNLRKAIAYVASRDRAWPFSFENLCEALGLDAGGLREELHLAGVRV